MMLAMDIADYLAANGAGMFDPMDVTGDIFIADYPTDPDNVIYIRDTGGYGSITAIDDMRRTVQIIVRGSSYIEAHDRAWQVHNLLAQKDQPVQLAADRNAIIKSRNSPYPLGEDARGRQEFTTNYEMITSRS